MPDATDETRTTASPYSTGGGGTRLEHRLGTVFLVRLLTAGPVLELGERAPDRVAFQQSPATSVDDLVATASAAGGTSIHLEIAARRTPKFIRSDKKTKELVAALVRADLDAERDSEPLVERRLAVAVSGQHTHTQEIAELAVAARGQSTAEEFVGLIRTPGKFATRRRLDHLMDMVAAALVEIADEDAGTPEHRCWSLLRRLWHQTTQQSLFATGSSSCQPNSRETPAWSTPQRCVGISTVTSVRTHTYRRRAGRGFSHSTSRPAPQWRARSSGTDRRR